MHTPLVIGVFFAVALAAAGMAAFFVRAWLYRREEHELAYFGISVSGFAAIAMLEGLMYWASYDPTIPVDRTTIFILVSVPGRLAMPTLLHFALRFAKSRHTRRIMIPVYLSQIPFAYLALRGSLWDVIPEPRTVHALGLDLLHIRAELSLLGMLFYATVPAIIIAVVALLGRAYRRGRHGALPAFVGSLVLLAALVHDATTSAGVLTSVPLTSLGLFALSCGVSLTLLTRYGLRSAELEVLTRRLGQRSRDLEASYAELKRSRQLLLEHDQLATAGELAAMLAHEVRNPLAIVTNAVASLRKGSLPPDQSDLLMAIIEEEMVRLERLIAQLMDYARPLEPRRERVDLADLAERSLALLTDESGIHCDLETQGAPAVDADSNLLRQAFDNIVTNAAQAMAKGGSLEVRISECDDGDGVSISFSDDGEGMDRESIKMAMAPFFTTRPTGTGLGLPWVARIVEAHDGTLDIDSRRGKGTTLTVTLPRRPSRRIDPAPSLSMSVPANR